MTTNELLLPRFKVIADYPGNTREVGSVSTEVATADYFRQYPANFRELQWHELLDKTSLPKYVKVRALKLLELPVDSIWEVYEIGLLEEPQYISPEGSPYYCKVYGLPDDRRINYNHFTPATEAEYLTYKNQSK